ncbi:MAG TPA: hypothetical protein VLS25_03120 [Dehalococcoidia bacterium]|nr:hypothetical protein [Dehalococcoidia bacterium]
MIKIEVDQDVFDWLEREARPFVDLTPNSVLRRKAGFDSLPPNASGMHRPASAESGGVVSDRPKLNESVLKSFGVREFRVAGRTPEYEGKKAHPRAYLDAALDAGLTNVPYFERGSKEGRSHPGDAASRVILKVGASDNASVVLLNTGEELKMADFVRRVLAERV